MAAYGDIPRSARPDELILTPRLYPTADTQLQLAVLPATASSLPSQVAQILRTVFNDIVIEGKTYPQEHPLDDAAFAAYFLAHDVFVGVIVPLDAFQGAGEDLTWDAVRQGRSWAGCIAGAYYVKPNYPGRSSHARCSPCALLDQLTEYQCCNGGFIVPPRHQGKGFGLALGRSYLHYAPKLGYTASVFNLGRFASCSVAKIQNQAAVYANNKASLAIWKRLGFSQVGVIPKAGRLKTGPGGTEEEVDAIVHWKAFSP